MLIRHCAGGVVFCEDSVFLLKNDKNEWVLPKGIIRNGRIANEVAKSRVRYEGGVTATVIAPVGETQYEYFSNTRKCPVHNQIQWFLMESEQRDYSVNRMENFTDGGFFKIDEAIDLITYSQDKALVHLAYKKFEYYKTDKNVI